MGYVGRSKEKKNGRNDREWSDGKSKRPVIENERLVDDEEFMELQEKYPGMSDSAIRALLRY